MPTIKTNRYLSFYFKTGQKIFASTRPYTLCSTFSQFSIKCQLSETKVSISNFFILKLLLLLLLLLLFLESKTEKEREKGNLKLN